PEDEIQKVRADESEDITVEPFTFEDATETSGNRPVSGLPSWLNDVADETPEQAPTWLDEIVAKPTEPPSPALDDSIPAWLRDLDSSSADLDTTPPLDQYSGSERPVEPEARTAPPSETGVGHWG